MTIDERLKQRGDFFKQFPVKDWHVLINFEKIVRNYIKMKQIMKEDLTED